MSYVLGLDLGTSSLKGLLMNKQGEVVAESASDYPILIPEIGYSEQNPFDWLEAAKEVIEDLIDKKPDMKERLEGISFSGQMHSLVLLGDDNEVLRSSILWNDVRTTKECERIMNEFGDELEDITKNIALEGFTLPKILWVQKHEPDIWTKTAHLMLPKDYLGFWLTNEYHMDFSDAAGTLLLDARKRAWSKEILTKFNISEKILPTLIASTGQIGVMKEELCQRFGFINEVKIFAGGADNACAAIGAGILKNGVGMSSIGTSGVFLAFEDEEIKDYDGKLHFFSHALPNANYSMGVTLAAGNSLNWFKEAFAKELSFQELLLEVDTVSVGSDDLLFAPYIVGERTPYSDAKIRGSFIGIDARHELKHFARAVLEGITFSLKDSQIIMETVANKRFEKIVSVGGGAKNKEWVQMQADIFNAPIVCLSVEQGPGLGAAMLAAVGCGWFKDLNACAQKFVSYQKEVLPIKENVRKYEKLYKVYQEIYPATKEICHQLGRM